MLMKYCSIIARFGRVFLSQKMKRFHIGFSEQIVLMFLAHHEYINQEYISKFFLIDKGAIAKTLAKLEEKNLIIRKENPENKRENIIVLSEEGKKIQHHMKASLDEWNTAFMKGLSENEVAELDRMIRIVSANAATITAQKWGSVHE
jgi:DNA-binding MarR family transcriptional regulator